MLELLCQPGNTMANLVALLVTSLWVWPSMEYCTDVIPFNDPAKLMLKGEPNRTERETFRYTAATHCSNAKNGSNKSMVDCIVVNSKGWEASRDRDNFFNANADADFGTTSEFRWYN
jgi:hypothetical protein